MGTGSREENASRQTRLARRDIADGSEAAGANSKVSDALAVVVDDGAALEDQVVGFGRRCRYASRCP